MGDDLMHAYVEGLKFFDVPLNRLATEHPLCTTCGVCCVVPASRSVTDEDVARLAAALGTTPDSLRTEVFEAPDNMGAPCPFLRRTGELYLCSVYEARPEICRSFGRCAPIQYQPDDAAARIQVEQDRFRDYFADVRDA